MATIAELKVIVDASQIDKARESLKSFNDAADKVQTSSSKISSGMKNASGGSAEFSGAAEKLIARVKELEATVGMSKGGVLSYKATLLGVNDVVKPLASSFDSLTAAQKNNDAISKEVARSQALADTEKHKMLESLKEEIALYGKSKSEIQLYRAEQLGIIDSVRPLVEELNRLKEAKEGADKAGKSGGDGLTKKQQELELLRQEGQAIQENLNHLKNTNAIEADRKRIQAEFAANQAKYDSKKIEIEETLALKDAEKDLAKSKNNVKLATEQELAEFIKFRGEVDPTTKALEKYYAQLDKIQKLRKQKKSGGGAAFDLEELDVMESKVKGNIKTLETFGATTGKTAKEIAFSMRGLPAQFTDIAVSLQGGQKPLTVFLQQGGQLKDMFGGILPALKAMGSYVLSLINPFTIVAAVVGSVALAMYMGSRSIDKLNNSLVTSGKIAKHSASDLVGYATASSLVMGSVGKNIDVVNEIISATDIHTDSILEVTKATVAWSSATGEAVSDILKDFDKLSKDPVKSVEELNKKYGFLTSTLYETIKALDEAGRSMDATKVATEALAQSTQDKALLMKASLGGVEKAWLAIKGAAVGTWDYIANLGRPEGLALGVKLQNEYVKALAETEKMEAAYASGDDMIFNRLQNQKKALEEAKNNLDAWNRELKLSEEAPLVNSTIALSKAFEGIESPVEKAKEAQAKYLDSVRNLIGANKEWLGSADAEEKHLEMQAKLQRDVNEARKAVSGDNYVKEMQANLNIAKEELSTIDKKGTYEKQHIKLVEEINELRSKGASEYLTHAERAKLERGDELIALSAQRVELEKNQKAQAKVSKEGKKTAVVRDDAATRLLLSLREQEAALREQLVTEGKLGKQAQEQAKMDRMFQDLKLKQKEGVLTVEQQSLLAGEQEIRNQRTVLVDLEKQNKLKQDNIKLDALRASLAEKLKEGDSRKTDLKSSLGVSDKEVSRIKERNDLLKEKNDLDAEAAKELREGGSAEIYEKQIKAYQDYYEERKRQTEDYYEFEDEAQQDWAKGISAGFANFIESQADMYSTMSELTQNTLGTLADGLSESLTQAILYGEDLQTSLQNLALTVTEQLLKGLIDVGLQFAINAAKEVVATQMVGAAKQAVITTTAMTANTATTTTAATQAAAGASTAAAWSPAALAASVGSFGAAAAIGLAAVVAIMASFGGFRKGGYTGNMGVDDVAGVVHGKEYVFDAAATSRIGISNLESLRSGKGISGQFSNNNGRTATVQSGGSTINQTINVVGQVDNQTATQIARRTAKRQSIAEARLG